MAVLMNNKTIEKKIYPFPRYSFLFLFVYIVVCSGL